MTRDSSTDALSSLLRLLPARPLIATSVKVSPGKISNGRLLCTLPRAAFAPQASHRFLDVAETFLGISVGVLRPWLNIADTFHFGIDTTSESHEPNVIRKVYLEFVNPAAAAPDLTYIAVKEKNGLGRLTRYLEVMMADFEDATALIDALGLPASVAISAKAFALALITTMPDYHVLQVIEDGTSRRSIDFNISDAEPTPQMAYALTDLLLELSITRSSAEQLLEEPISHVAIGAGQSGEAFVTLYRFPRNAPSEPRNA